MAQAIVHRSRKKLRSAIEDEMNRMRWNFAGDLREMMKVLEVIEPVLEDAEKYSLWDKASREWLRRVRNAAYGISDMVDELKDTGPRTMAGISIGPKKNHMSNKIKEMKLELRMLQESNRFASMPDTTTTRSSKKDTTTTRVQQRVLIPPSPHPPPFMNFTPGSLTSPSRAVPIPPRPLNRRVWGRRVRLRRVDEEDIVGRGENKQRIIATLSAIDITEGPTILPIFGLAAIGKTTLAAMVFKDTGFGGYKLRIWVDVTPKFDLPQIGNYIMSEILQEIKLETEHQKRYHSYKRHQVSKKVINTDADTDTDTDTDESSQESEEEMNQVTYRTLQKIEKTNEGSEGASKVSEEENRQGSDEVSQVSEDETSEGPDGASQESEDETIQSLNEISPITEEEIHQDSDDVDYITKHLHELLNGMKVLIVLDDLWEEDPDKLEQLKRMLGVGIKGSKVTVIVTTCNEGIARKVCTVKPYKLDPLMNDMCWTIIKKTSYFKDRPESDEQELERIGPQIASKCGGLPLAAQELGRSLRLGDARSCAEEMQRDVWNNLQSHKDVLRSLELCYKSMPPDLRLCFAYCTIFPQGDNIAKVDIIHQWIALGLVEPSGALSITQVAEEYIRRLLDISFLQTAESAASTSGSGDMVPTLLTMHELAHALARSVGEELIVLDDRMGTSDQSKCCRYALVTDFGVKLSSRLPTQLRALRCVGCRKTDLGNDAFSFTRCLRVLHLNECAMQKLPDSICQLRQLGYLNLSGCSQLVTLPESFGDLLNLWYINLSRCYGLAELPESFGELKKLVHLDLSFWCCFEGILVLGGLISLEHLNLSQPCCYRPQHRPHLEGLKDVLCKLTNLQYLNLSMCMNPIFCYMSEEKCLEYIRSCTSGLSNLKHLDLSHNIFLVALPDSLGELQKLHTLDLTGCIRLKSISKRICEMNTLKLIVIRNCRGLESCSFVVRTDDGGFSSNLVQLEELNCQDLEISCLEKVKSTEEAHRIQLVEKIKVEKLILCWTVGSQGSVEDDANLLGELKPPHALQCLEMYGYRGTCHPAWASSISSHLPNLMEVTMEDFPGCRSLPPFALLPNLQRLVLRRMASITRIDAGELSGGNTAAAVLHRLSNFTIDDMESLEEFNTTYYGASGEQVMFSAIDELVIQKCSKLSFRSLPPRARRLVISDCSRVMSSSRLLAIDCDQVIAMQRKTAAGGSGGVEGPCTASAPVAELVIHGCIVDWSLLRYIPGLRTLSISNVEGMTSLPQDIGHLKSLHDLQIVCCKQLKRFPKSMQHLTSLHSIQFAECDSIKKLPKWFGCLTSLEKLSIHKCLAFKSLPRSIKGLNNLKDLDIAECNILRDWCDLAKNKKKLEHIQPEYSTFREDITSDQMATWDYFFGPDATPPPTLVHQCEGVKSCLLPTSATR